MPRALNSQGRQPAGFILLIRILALCAMCAALCAGSGCKPKQPAAAAPDEFVRLSNLGKSHYERGDGPKAVETLQQALALQPSNPDALLNLANACLLAGQPEKTISLAQEILKLDTSSAAAHYLMGCAYLRLGKAKEAVQHLQQSKDIDRTFNAVSFQLGRAYQQLGQLDAAAQEFEELIQFDPEHPAAHYNLSQVLMRLGRNDEAAQALQAHQKLLAGKQPPPSGPGAFERAPYTQIRTPFQQENPDPKGIPVAFTDATESLLGELARSCSGPVGMLDLYHQGWPSLFVAQSNGFRLLLNSNGILHATGPLWPGATNSRYHRCLVGDLNNDRYEDVIVLGDGASHVFKFATNAAATDISRFSRLADVRSVQGLLADLDFTAKLDLLAVTHDARLRVLRNLGNPYFTDNTNSGITADLTGATQLVMEDWNGDEMADLLVIRKGLPPQLLLKQRGGALMATNWSGGLPTSSAGTAGDWDNDLRPDLVLVTPGNLVCIPGSLKSTLSIPLGGWLPTGIELLDYDNDGWLDLIAWGDGLRAWRNLGPAGFEESTANLKLAQMGSRRIDSISSADFDRDGDTDLVLATATNGLQFLRNDGANTNAQIKLHLIGNKSNASGLGIRIEIAAGNLHLRRRVRQLPIEIGLGRHFQVDSLTAHWFDVNLNFADVKVDPRSPIPIEELVLPTGSCPYFYAWDGKRFRFVTDILGAAPVGLRVSDTRFVDADPREYVWIGSEAMFPPTNGHYLAAITSELREVIYLDEAKLVAVDHPAGTEVHTTGKMVPGRPFPPHQIVTLHQRRALLDARNASNQPVTADLQETDLRLVSPPAPRIPQLRGLAEPHSLVLDFGPLPVQRPLVLALTGWLRFGGGMVNVGASHNPELPFPFPTLETEVNGRWVPIQVGVGVPAGKTKTILVELDGKLPAGAGRLRLSSAFELHWDRIALFEKRDNAETQITQLAPSSTDLHWHGFGEYENWPWYLPLTPNHDRVSTSAKWTIQPQGWCTRYGEVGPLIAQADNAFALINGGDELLLRFAANQLPPRLETTLRDFFLFTSGWEKDSDFHVELGWLVEPYPWHGMDDQQYGRQPRPAFPEADALMARYNTRWVGPFTLSRK